MQSRTTRQFWRLFSDLPFDAQRDAKRAYRLFQAKRAHPGLDRIVWYWIGSHSDYDRLV